MDDSDESDVGEDETAAQDGDAADPELSDATLERMVRELHPEWSLREATPSAEGTDLVYFLTVETPEGTRKCILKACDFLDPEEFRPEPYLLGALDRRTSVPVPRMLGAVDSRDDLPAPYFLMERREGEVRENDARDLPVDVMERVGRDAGRNLAEIHDLGEFERFGPIRLARDVRGESNPDRDSTGIPVDSRILTVPEEGHDSWRVRFEAMVDGYLDGLPDRFADLEPDLRAFIDERLDALDRDFVPVLGDDDYRLGNLLVDPQSGETRAVLDWGNASTMEAQYNLLVTEQYLSGWALHDDSRRKRVREALWEGYEETGGANLIRRGSDFERRRELYLAFTRTFPLICFSLWYGDFPTDERERYAELNRQAVRELAD